VLGSGAQVLAPVYVDDVAAILAAADDRGQTVSGTWGLEGPDRVGADEPADLLAGRHRRQLPISGRCAQRLARLPGKRVAATAPPVRQDVRAVVIWGGEKVFAAGADIKQMAEATSSAMKGRIGGLQEAFCVVEDIPKVTIAAINGFCLGGGCELALTADFR